MKVSIDGYDAAKVNAGLLKAAVGVIGVAELGNDYSGEGMECETSPGENALVIDMTLPALSEKRFFKAIVR